MDVGREFLPISREDMQRRGWQQADFVYVIGDAYVDHPSFGPAIISRVLEAAGYRVGIIAQPDCKNPGSINALGEPRLGFLVSSGNMDSMVNHYSVARQRRKTDAYSPGGVMGLRPDRALTVYSRMIRRLYPDKPIVIGGIEASLRRLAHYDYWSDSLMRSVLLDSGADLLLYGMGEKSIVETARALESGEGLTSIRGSAYKTDRLDGLSDYIALPSYPKMLEDRREYAESFRRQMANTDPYSGKKLVERYAADLYIVQNPQQYPLTTPEMDAIYALPYTRAYHPCYEEAGGIPAITEVKFSLVSARGCFGGCSFCALTYHQGRIIQARSHESLLEEAELLTKLPDFKGYIHDVGGPTANFRHTACEKQLERGVCPGRQCLFPSPCPNLKADHSDYLELLRKLRALPRIKKVFIRSGLRFDYIMYDKDDRFLRELCEHHVSGQLKVAPEHVSDRVLKMMGKPPHSVYNRFAAKYKKINDKLGMKQYLVPYLMSSHPGCRLSDAVELAEFLRDIGYMPEQVQDFYPTPSTVSTCMYYTGIDPRTMTEVYVPRSPHEKAMQRALIQYRNPNNYSLVAEALQSAGRSDLIGYDKKCLIKPRAGAQAKAAAARNAQRRGQQNDKPSGGRTSKNSAPKSSPARGKGGKSSKITKKSNIQRGKEKK